MFVTSSCPLCRDDGCSRVPPLAHRYLSRCIATSAWETLEAMRASYERVAPIRDRAALMFAGSARVERNGHRPLHREFHPSHEGACVRATWLKVVPDQLGRSLESPHVRTS